MPWRDLEHEDIYGMEPGEVFWRPRTWAGGGPLYIVYGPLLYGCTTIMYEGKPSVRGPGAFWRVISEHGVSALFTAPTAFRLSRRNPNGEYLKKYELSKFRTLFLAVNGSIPTPTMGERHAG